MSGGSNKLYNFINIVVIGVTALLFIYNYREISSVLFEVGLAQFLIIILTVFFVHLIKAARLYLAFYGTELKLSEFLKTYCKVTPVSLIFPYKLGEFFKMYCYGKGFANPLRGVVIVLLDRFMDTVALVAMILFVWLFSGGRVTGLVYILLLVLLLLIMIYYVFPGMFKSWKKYFLSTKATERKIAILGMLEALNRVYVEVKRVSEGRGVIMFFMSLIAWGIEIGSVSLQVGWLNSENLNEIVSRYLLAAIGRGQCKELTCFIFVSIFLMLAIYVVLKLGMIFSGKKDNN